MPSLTYGNYWLRATAKDKAGNAKIVDSYFTVSDANSVVKLSTASAKMAQNSITLVFTGALDAKVAADISRYVVKVNSIAVAIQSVSYSSSNYAVTLTLAPGSLVTDIKTNIAWTKLYDSVGKLVAGNVDITPTQPTISINDVTVTEGNAGTKNATFTITLSKVGEETISINATPTNNSALSPADYVSGGVTLSFAAGETSKTFSVPVNGDLMKELDETFFVNLSSPVNASIVKAQGIGTIINDDAAPALTINDVSTTEGNSGSTNLIFTVTLSQASGQIITVKYATANGVASSSSDYTAKNGTLTFAAGQTSQTISVAIKGDAVLEGDETLFVLLSSATNASIGKARGTGTILNDDISG